jgi:hypothetical protein
MSGVPREVLHEEFKKYDVDGDDILTQDQLRDLIDSFEGNDFYDYIKDLIETELGEHERVSFNDFIACFERRAQSPMICQSPIRKGSWIVHTPNGAIAASSLGDTSEVGLVFLKIYCSPLFLSSLLPLRCLVLCLQS